MTKEALDATDAARAALKCGDVVSFGVAPEAWAVIEALPDYIPKTNAAPLTLFLVARLSFGFQAALKTFLNQQINEMADWTALAFRDAVQLLFLLFAHAAANGNGAFFHVYSNTSRHRLPATSVMSKMSWL